MSRVSARPRAQSNPVRTSGRRRLARSGAIGTVVALLLQLTGLSLSTVAAGAAETTAVLTVAKSATVSEVAPGESFVWEVQVGCESLESICVDAVVADAVPAPFQLTDVKVVGTENDAAVTVDGNDVDIAFQETDDRFPGVVGLGDGQRVSVLLSVVLPTSTPVSADGIPVENTVEATAANAAKVTASSTVTPRVAPHVAVDATKSWAKSSQIVGSAETNTVTLGVRNTSNVDVDELRLVDPADGTAAPFEFVVFDGFTGLVFPEGADRVAVTAVTGDGTVAGEPAETLDLPAGVDPADVTGLSFVFTAADGAILAGGSAGSVGFAVTQRDGLPTDSATTVDNTVAAQVARGDATAEDTAAASFAIRPLTVSVDAGKRFDANKVLVGDASTVTVSARNTSNHELDELSIVEPAPGTPGLADNGLTFAGFGTSGDGAIPDGRWPAGATAATLTFAYADGAGSPVSIAKGDAWPAPEPGRSVSGFAVTFDGPIATGATASVPFRVGTDDGTPVRVTNTVQGAATSPAGTAEDTAAAALDVTPKSIDTRVTKRLTPGEIAGVVGQQVVATLSGDVRDSNAPVRELVVEDSPNSADGSDLWGAFRADKAVVTSVPAGSTLQVKAWDGAAWVNVGDAVTGPGALDVDLPASTQGVRFVFTSDTEPGFSNGFFVKPRILFELTEPQEVGTEYTNCAASAVAGDNGMTGDDGPRCDTVEVVRGDGAAVPLLDLDTYKTWRGSELWLPVTGENPSAKIDLQVATRSPLPVDRLGLSEPTGATDPFDLLDITRIDSVALPKGADDDTVAIRLENADGDVVFERTGADAIAEAKALDAAALADVTRVFVSVSGVIDEDERLKVTLSTRVRDATREAGTPIADALAALEPAHVIDNSVKGSIADGDAARTEDASAELIVRPLELQPLEARLVKDFGRDSGTLYSADPEATLPVTLRIDRVQGAPTEYVVEDTSATFWNAFDLAGIRSVTGSGSDLTGRIDYLTGGEFTLDATGAPVVSGGTWKPGAAFEVPTGSGTLPDEAAALPEGVDAASVHGIRVTFSAADGATIPSGAQRLVFDVTNRSILRTGGPVTDTGAATPMPGEDEPGVVTNVATATASNPARTVDVPQDDDTYRIVPGTTEFSVAKTPDASQVVPGEVLPFKLTVENTGSTPLVNPVFTDVIPGDADGALLVYDPVRNAPASFTVEPAEAAIPVDPSVVDVTVADDGLGVVVSFPEGTTLLPGERYTVTLPLTVRAGVAPGVDVDNLFVFTADGDVRAEDGATVQVLEGGAYQRIKDVREIVAAGDDPSGVVNTLDGSDECVEDEGFFRVPCLVKTRPGGEEEWRLRVTNSGNLPTTELTIVDVLPYPGDTGTSLSLGGLSRGTTWTPTYLGDLSFGDLPEGTTTTVWHQTASDERCAFTGDPSSADPYGEGCSADQWHLGEPADASTVTALKVEFSFEQPLQPGDGVEVTYRTRTAVTLPDGAPELNAPAWNSMVVTTATDKGDSLDWETLEPNKAGVAFELPDYRVAVGDVVWVDSDRDGVQDDGEPVLDGVAVTLHERNGTPVGDPVATDEHGRYLFDDLPVGEYYITFELTEEQAARFAFTSTGAGDAATDSDADPATGRTAVFRLDRPAADLPDMVDSAGYPDQEVTASYIDPTIDAGVVPFMVSVGDYVWFDEDGDGLQGDSEPGIPGVVLELVGPDGGPVVDVHGDHVTPVATDADGFYEFVDLPVLPAGQHYTVRIDSEASASALAGMVPTDAGAGDDRSLDSSTGSAESGDLVSDGDRDPSLDFGYVMADLPTLPLPPGLATTGPQSALVIGLLAAALGLVFAGALSVVVRRRVRKHG